MMSDKKNRYYYYEFFKLDQVINYDIDSNKCFIVANEKKFNGKIVRMFLLFPNFETFLKLRKKFPHCHEILVNHKNSKVNNSGRLVFDFDINALKMYEDNFFTLTNEKKKCYDQLVKKLKKIRYYVEKYILLTINKFMIDVDTSSIDFVWSTSTNTSKLSKHLTVKNFYFDDWIKLSKIFYDCFTKVWNDNINWLPASALFDKQIIRKNASLRMVGSKKFDDTILIFDDCDKYNLSDSLIRNYSDDDPQVIKINNFNRKILTKISSDSNNTSTSAGANKNAITNIKPRHLSWNQFLHEIKKNYYDGHASISSISGSNTDSDSDSDGDTYSDTTDFNDDVYTNTKLSKYKQFKKTNDVVQISEIIYEKSLELVNDYDADTFRMGKKFDRGFTLLRKKPSNCLCSGKIHENENAYITIVESEYGYDIYYGCYRNCNSSKTVYIGNITRNGYIFKNYNI
jgi:hypothetical protein